MCLVTRESWALSSSPKTQKSLTQSEKSLDLFSVLTRQLFDCHDWSWKLWLFQHWKGTRFNFKLWNCFECLLCWCQENSLKMRLRDNYHKIFILAASSLHDISGSWHRVVWVQRNDTIAICFLLGRQDHYSHKIMRHSVKQGLDRSWNKIGGLL